MATPLKVTAQQVLAATNIPTQTGLPPQQYQTVLAPAQEQAFQTWVKANKIPFNPNPNADYDMRGFYQALQQGKAQPVVKGGVIHYPDTWKTPYHKTFSNQSIYATPDAPKWVGSKLIANNGKVIADEGKKRGG